MIIPSNRIVREDKSFLRVAYFSDPTFNSYDFLALEHPCIFCLGNAFTSKPAHSVGCRNNMCSDNCPIQFRSPCNDCDEGRFTFALTAMLECLECHGTGACDQNQDYDDIDFCDDIDFIINECDHCQGEGSSLFNLRVSVVQAETRYVGNEETLGQGFLCMSPETSKWYIVGAGIDQKSFPVPTGTTPGMYVSKLKIKEWL